MTPSLESKSLEGVYSFLQVNLLQYRGSGKTGKESRAVAMKSIKILAWLGLVLMSGAIIYGFLYGDFSGEGTRLLNMVWGQVTLIDIYIVFSLFIAWVVYREKTGLSKGIWTLLILTLGSFAICLYILIAAYRCRNNPKRFFMGSHRG